MAKQEQSDRASFQIDGNRVSFWLRVKPRSSRQTLELASSGELCLRSSVPPVEGKANDACVRFLARCLRLPPSSVTILAGHRSRRKLIRIDGRSAGETIERLRELAGGKTRQTTGD